MRAEARGLVRGTVFISLSRVLESVVAVVFSIVVARTLGGDYGYVGVAMGVWGILNVVSTLGVTQANTKYVAEQTSRGERASARATVARTAALEAALNLIASVALFLAAEPLADEVFGKPELAGYLRLVSPMLFIAAMGGVWLSTFQGLHRYDAFATVTGVTPVVRLASAVVLLAWGYGVEGALLGYLVGHLVALAMGTTIGLWLVRRELSGPDEGDVGPEGPPTAGMLTRFGVAVTFGTLAAVVSEWADKLMLAVWVPIEEVAFYTIAFGMISMLIIIPRSINTAFFPLVSTLHGRGDMGTLRGTTESVMRITFVLICFPTMAMMAVAPWVIGLFYGELFLPAAGPFYILAIWGLVRFVGLIAYSVPLGMGRPMVGAWVLAGTAVLNVVLNAVLIPYLGILGAAMATTVSYVAGFTYLIIVALDMVGGHFPWSRVLRAFGAALGASMMVYVLFSWIPDVTGADPWYVLLPVLLVLALLGSAVYLVLLGVTGALAEDDVDLVRSLGFYGSGTIARIMDRIAALGSPRPPEGQV